MAKDGRAGFFSSTTVVTSPRFIAATPIKSHVFVATPAQVAMKNNQHGITLFAFFA
jgi:hypothetical protein